MASIITSTIERFFTVGPGQALIKQAQDHEASAAAERRRKDAKIVADAIDEHSRREAATKKALVPLLNRAAAAQTELDKLNAEITALRQEDRARYQATDYRLSRARNALEMNPQPQLLPFIEKLQQEMVDTSSRFDGSRGKLINGAWAVLWCNTESVRKRQDAISEALGLVRRLALEPIEGIELDRHLQDLWDSLPSIEERPADTDGHWNRSRGR